MDLTEGTVSKEQVAVWQTQTAKMREKLFGAKPRENRPVPGKKLATDILNDYFDMPSHSAPLSDDARKKMNEVMSHLHIKKKK